MKKQTYDYDLIVIGSGAGGSVAANIVAAEGKRVAVVESGLMGGECPNWGCIPSKAMLEAAKTYENAKNAGTFGIRAGMAGFNYPSVRAWKDLVIKRTEVEKSDDYYAKHGVGVYHGRAHFISPHEITVNRRHLSAANFLIATGAVSIPLNVPVDPGITLLDARAALDLTRPPKTLFIIGGSATGTEFAQLFSAFGSKVYIADISPRLLPREDQEVSQLVEAVFAKRRGIQVLTKTKVTSIERDGAATRVNYMRGGEKHSARVDQVLVAVGKAPTTDLGLENANVSYGPRGIPVNDHLQTNVPHIYAAGDVLGRHMFTHMGLYESKIAANNILHKVKLSPDYRAVPRATFLTPEIASVGLSEEQCLKQDLGIKTAVAPINIIGRANVSNAMDGFIKIITDKRGVLLGATVVSQNAGEVIHELGLAIHHRLTAAQVASTIHAFPTWSESVRVVCEKLRI